MSFVALQDLGDLGPSSSEPVSAEWHGQYHVARLRDSPNHLYWIKWVLVAALLVLVKGNRNRQAWLILIPLLLLTVILKPVIQIGVFGILDAWDDKVFTGIVLAWTLLWLTSDWPARCHSIRAFVCAWIPAAVISIAIPYYILSSSCDGAALTVYLLCAASLPSAFALGRLPCRKTFSPRRFTLWLFPSLIVSFLLLASAIAILPPKLIAPPAIDMAAILIIKSPHMGLALYLVNLPFMILAFRCPLYRQRLYKILRLNMSPTKGGSDS